MPVYIDEALNEVVLTFGIAKAEIVRHAIVEYLRDKGAVPPTFTYEGSGLSRGRLRDKREGVSDGPA